MLFVGINTRQPGNGVSAKQRRCAQLDWQADDALVIGL